MNSSINKDECKSNQKSSLTNFLEFIKSTFVKSRKIPIISISLFIIVVVLNSIQFFKNDRYFLQNQIIVSNKNYPNGKMNIGNILLFIYELVGINSFFNNGTLYILVFIITYLCLALIETNIGYISLLFLLFIDMIFDTSWYIFSTALCENYSTEIYITMFKMCCGSFILYMSLGFVLFLIQNNIVNKFYRIIVIFIMLLIWTICILFDRYSNFNDMKNNASQQTCTILTWHSANFFFGICCGFALGNKKNDKKRTIITIEDYIIV